MIASHAVQITPEILSLIAGIDEFKGAWRALGTLAPDRLAALRRVATIESIGSSTRKALVEQGHLELSSHPRRTERSRNNRNERARGPSGTLRIDALAAALRPVAGRS